MDEQADVPLLLRRTSDACSELATAAVWLQDQFGSLHEAGRIQPCRETTMAMQELDRISQVLHGLASLSNELAVHTNGKFAPSKAIARAIRLDSLRSRVLGENGFDDSEDEFWH